MLTSTGPHPTDTRLTVNAARISPRASLATSLLPCVARSLLPCVAMSLLLPSCSGWLFSGYDDIDRSRPVALIETTGGVEYGATTEFGILTLGRTATEGPCRVHYFLGPTPIVEDGTVKTTGALFARADMDLKTQHLRVLDRAPTSTDVLVAMWTPDGVETQSVEVALATDPGVQGDVLMDPGTELPAGAAIFANQDGLLRFVGLVAGRATLEGSPSAGKYYVFAGVARVREMLAVPEVHPTDYETKFRPDSITITKPVRPGPVK